MRANPLLIICVFGACAGASFLFALAETALFTLNRWQVRQLAERSPAGALIARLLAAPQDLLATIVLGNTLANAGLVALGFWLITQRGWPPWLTLGGVLAAILVGAEVVPKTLAVRAPEFWSLRVARPMLAVQWLSGPVRRLAQRLNEAVLRLLVPRTVRPAAATTSEEYAELLEIACQQGTLGQSEKDIILQIITLDQRTAKDVMRPRASMEALPDTLSVEEMIAAARQFKHRRLPLYDGSPDTILGLLNTRRLLLDPQADLMDVIEFPSFVPETMDLLKLLRSLQRQKRGLAIVLDEFGSTAGVVTIEDILGAMVGHIRSESELESFVMQKLGPGRWRVSGTMRLDDFRREYPALADVPGVDTLGGLVLVQRGVVPASGETINYGRLRLTVTKAEERRVRELVITLAGVGDVEGAP